MLWVAETLTIVGFCMCYPFLPFYLADLGVHSPDRQALWAGALTASTSALMAITAPFWGMAADRFGRKPMLVRAMACGAITTGLMGLVSAPWQLLILFILDGAFSGTVTAAMTLVASTTPRQRIGYALGLLQTAIFTGMSLGPLIGGVLADRVGYRPIFGVGSLLLFVAATLTLVLARETFVRPSRTVDNEGAHTSGPPLMAILLAGAVPAAVGMLFVLRLTTSAATPVLPLFVESLAGAGAPLGVLTGLAFGASGFGSAIASLTLGRAADRLGHRRVLIAAGGAMAALFVPLALVRAPWQLVVCYGLLGVAAGGITPSAQGIVADQTPLERRGVVFGVTSAVGSAGGFVGPFMGSLLATNASVRFVFLAGGAMTFGCTLWLARTLRAPSSDAGPVGSRPLIPATPQTEAHQ